MCEHVFHHIGSEEPDILVFNRQVFATQLCTMPEDGMGYFCEWLENVTYTKTSGFFLGNTEKASLDMWTSVNVKTKSSEHKFVELCVNLYYG